MKKPIKQINIFDQVDHMDDEGNILKTTDQNKCPECNQSTINPELCDSCSHKFVEKYISINALND